MRTCSFLVAAGILASCVQTPQLRGGRSYSDIFNESPLTFNFVSFDYSVNKVNAEVILANDGTVPVCISGYFGARQGYLSDIDFSIRRPIDSAIINFPRTERIDLTSGTPNRNSQDELILRPGESLGFRYVSTWGELAPFADVEIPMLGPPNGKPLKEYSPTDRVALVVEVNPNDCADLKVEKEMVVYLPKIGLSSSFNLR